MQTFPTSLDGLLNRRVALEQPQQGYRVAMDTVFLAAAVPAREGARILDLGCGVGGAMLALACRVPGLAGSGLELQPELVELCRRNIARNAFAAGLEVRQGDVAALPEAWREIFDHALMNPPYHDEQRHDVSANAIKRTANAQKKDDLAGWIAGAGAALKNGGTLTLIHRADRSEVIEDLLGESFGQVEILPLLPQEGAPPKRAIFRARKGAPFSIRVCPPLVLHKIGGAYTDQAEAVLRHAQPLTFQSP